MDGQRIPAPVPATPPPPAPPPASRGGRSTGSVVLVVLGVLVALVGLSALGAGGGLLALDALRADGDGFLTSESVRLTTGTNALVSEDVEIVSEAAPGEWVPELGDVAVRVTVTPLDDDAVFVGVGAADDVAAYLDDVAHDVVTQITPGTTIARAEPGDATPADPRAQDLWVASAVGTGSQALTWDLAPGDWTLVVMDADGGTGVDVTATAGLRAPFVVPVGVALLVAAGLLLALAVVLLIAGAATRRGARASDADGPGGPVGEVAHAGAGVGAVSSVTADRGYPAVLTAELDPGVSRWQWLVKWFLAIPHVVVLAFLWVACTLLTVVAGFSILFTRRYPRALFDFNVGVLRWTWRVTYYAFSVLGTDAYPPFTLDRTDYPADFDVAYPEEGLSRGLVLVKWWLLAIPHYLVVAIFTGGVVSWSAELGAPEGWQLAVGGGLTGVLTLVAVVVLAVRGRYPQGLFDLLMGLQRWVYRVTAYAALMTDEYPPFRLDPGGDEPPLRVDDSTPTPPPVATAATTASDAGMTRGGVGDAAPARQVPSGRVSRP